MRGKAQELRKCPRGRGIIPAHAGKRSIVCTFCDALWDHPRSCGEKCGYRAWAGCRAGSSPLMRGKVFFPTFRLCASRIIPAHAGKRQSFDGLADAYRDHPRSCGEKTLRMLLLLLIRGSSPLMRGKVLNAAQALYYIGIIPAHAGKRLKQVAKTGYFRETLHFSISIWYTKWVSLQSADTRCIPAVSN